VGVPVLRGGLGSALERIDDLPSMAVVAVPVESLAETTIQLARCGVRHMLTEKPAGLNLSELYRLQEEATTEGCSIYVAYNRRFYESVRKAREIIETDGGLGTIWFDFTERGSVVRSTDKPKEVLENWFLANSTHVVDLAFDLGGEPTALEARVSGGLEWHPKGSRFVGCGTTTKSALFSYRADWEGPGGWGIEVTTRAHRLILRPLEGVQVQRLGSTSIEECELDDELDRRFKPGIYRQMQSFLSERAGLLTLEQHVQRVEGPLMAMVTGGSWPG
jgi:hypothetical protein